MACRGSSEHDHLTFNFMTMLRFLRPVAWRDFPYKDFLELLYPSASSLIFLTCLSTISFHFPSLPLDAKAHPILSHLCRPAVHQPIVHLQRSPRRAVPHCRLPGRVPRSPLPGREGRPLLPPAGTDQQRVQRGELLFIFLLAADGEFTLSYSGVSMHSD